MDTKHVTFITVVTIRNGYHSPITDGDCMASNLSPWLCIDRIDSIHVRLGKVGSVYSYG